MSLGTSWEAFGNLRGTNQEERGKDRKSLPAHPHTKRKKKSPSQGHAKPSRGLQGISVSKTLALGLESRCIDGFMSQGF
jgi:hypothetical protein